MNRTAVLWSRVRNSFPGSERNEHRETNKYRILIRYQFAPKRDLARGHPTQALLKSQRHGVTWEYVARSVGTTRCATNAHAPQPRRPFATRSNSQKRQRMCALDSARRSRETGAITKHYKLNTSSKHSQHDNPVQACP